MSKYTYFENDTVRYLENNNNDISDLYLCYCGIEKCLPCHSFGPAIRENFLIHYILNGKGKYKVNDKIYYLDKNQGFIIKPNELTYYEADENEPWEYVWISFNGIKASKYLNSLNLDNLIFSCAYDDEIKKYIFEMLNTKTMSLSDDLKLQGLLYLFLSTLSKHLKKEPIKSDTSYEKLYIRKSIEFIDSNFSNNIKITDIANYVGLNRSYLYTLFKKNLNVSPQEFLLEFRMNKASNLLKSTNYSISYISNSIGYKDPLSFSKTFKKFTGVSPKDYRNKI